MMRPQRRRPRPTKEGDTIILTAFALRFVIGLVAFGWITSAAFRAEPRFGWIVLLIALAYVAVTGTMLGKGLLGFKKRYGQPKPGEK